MIVYNVSIKVLQSRAEEWIAWMNEEHMPDLLGTQLIQKASLFELEVVEEDQDGSRTFVAQYEMANKAAYETYLKKFADEMRKKGLERFGDSFIAFRTLMRRILVHP